MKISAELLADIVAHAREEAPNECCGVVAVEVDGSRGGESGEGRYRRAARVHRTVNTAASPLRFEVDGRELLQTIDAIEADGQELGAIYHSHTRTPPYPSQTDINFAANWPGVEWIIVGLAAEAVKDASAAGAAGTAGPTKGAGAGVAGAADVQGAGGAAETDRGEAQAEVRSYVIEDGRVREVTI